MRPCARAAPALLLHVNVLLAAYGGAALATGARLKWDPSAYLPLRELLPREYRVAAVALPAAGAALLLLAHLAAAALREPAARARRTLLLLYAAGVALMAGGEAALAGWLAARVAAWARGAQAEQLRLALELRHHLQPLLEHLAHWHPLPTKINDIVQEAEADAPRNLYVLAAAAALLVLLQAAALLLALLAAAAAPPAAPRRAASAAERAPLKAVYRNGRLEMA